MKLIIWRLCLCPIFSLLLLEGYAQEKFVRWLDSEHYLLSSKFGSTEKLFKVAVTRGGREDWYETSEILPVSGERLEDGSLFQVRNNDIYIIKKNGEEIRITFDEDLEEKNPKVSPDAKKIAYTKNNDLYYYDWEAQRENRLTFDGSESIYNGWASWVYYEEILGRASRYAAFWWSPDSRRIVFLHFNDSPVPIFSLFREEGTHGSLETMYYPKAGDNNPDVHFMIADLPTGNVRPIEEDRTRDQYSAWPFWTPDSRYVLIQELNREQDTLQIIRVDAVTGDRLIIYEESQNSWVEFFDQMYFISNEEFIIRSNQSGWDNYYLCSITGKKHVNITPVDWTVSEMVHVEKEKEQIFFYGSGAVTTEQHFFRANLSGGGVTQITKGEGYHFVALSPGGKYIFDRYSSFDRPEIHQILDRSGKALHQITVDEPHTNRMAGVKVEMLKIETEDGFELPGYWVLPKSFSKSVKYPVVFDIYGGPGAGTVRNVYRDYSNDFYANNGIIRISVDHRGSGKFGKKGMNFLHRSLGKWEIDDLISAVKWLRTLEFIDGERIGITGGSYGGYVTCMALTYGADYFTHGISLYPVTDWRLYDNVYTERYMDHPKLNPEGYRKGSAMEHVHRFKGELLVVHGTADDNVHLQNTLQFIDKMQDLGKGFEMMVYPGERHGWGGPKGVHLNRLIHQFWKKHFF